VSNSNLVVPFLRINYFTVVEDINSEKSLFLEIVATFFESDIQRSRGMVRSNENLLFKNDTILPRSVFVNVLKWLNLLNFFEVKFSSVANHLNLQLITLICIIRWHTFNDNRVSLSTIWLQN
jgi:hypothetical protein